MMTSDAIPSFIQVLVIALLLLLLLNKNCTHIDIGTHFKNVINNITFYPLISGQKRFKCDQCNFSCIQSFDLVKHKYIHGGEKPYKCKMCPKQFTRPARLREHERLHTGERPYTCEQCGKSFAQLSTLKSHKVEVLVSSHGF